MSYDRDLLGIFSGEQGEHIERLRMLTDSLASGAGESRAAVIEEILRRAHTLKGAARAVGLKVTEQLAHRLETLFMQMARASGAPAADSIAAVHRSLDEMEDVLAAALAGRPIPELRSDTSAAKEPAPDPLPASDSPSAPAAAMAPGTETLRVSVANVDSLVRASSQLVALLSTEGKDTDSDTAQRAARFLNEFGAHRRACIPFLQAHKDEVEVLPVRECLEFVAREVQALAAETRQTASQRQHRSWEVRRQVTGLHQNAVRVRMIPAESVYGAFGAMVRQIAHEDGKRVIFRAEGLQVQADRVVLQSLKDPVMHLLRNAVSHGIESPQERIAAGKEPEGSVQLRFEAEGSRLRISVEDDGRGLNTSAVRNRAIASGLYDAEDTDQELSSLLFHSGFSTSEQVTSLSGRGLGLSVVKETAERLQGDVEVRSLQPAGLGFTITVGLLVSTQQLLLMEVAGSMFALPTQQVRELTRTRMSGLQTVGGREVLKIGGANVPVTPLADLLGLAETPPAAREEQDRWLFVVAVAIGEQRIGLIVDRLVDEREAVVKDPGLPARAAGLAAGGIALEDGRVAIVLNPGALLERFRAGNRRPVRQPESAAAIPVRRILIVDDSITTRSLEKSILEAHGFNVTAAVDGLDALEKLERETFDLVISDVSMPRMDGMQLLQEMKKRSKTEHIPVIILSSMESQSDQERGMALGADAYLIKRKFDQQELLRTVRQIL